MRRPLRFTDAVIAAFVVRFVVMAISWGSNDTFLWYDIVRSVSNHGLVDAYRINEMLNHPPGPTIYMTATKQLADLTALPYPWLMKLPAVLADAVAGWAVLRIVGARAGRDAGRSACLLYLWNPVSILLSAYHGNTDSVYGALILLAAWTALRRPFVAGVALAGAANVKLLPVVVGPALLAVQRSRSAALRFLAGCAIAVVPFVPLLLIDASTISKKVFGYTTVPQSFGPTQILTLVTGGWGDDPGTGPLAAAYSDAGRFILAAAIVATTLLGRRRGLDPIAMAFAAGATYVLVTPGLGIQHLAMIAAVYHAADPRRARWFLVVGGLYVITTYGLFLDAAFPLRSLFFSPAPFPTIATGIVLWFWLARQWWNAMNGRLACSDPHGIDRDADTPLGSLDAVERVGELVGRGRPHQPATIHRAAHLDAQR